jgi:hypothetical protein
MRKYLGLGLVLVVGLSALPAFAEFTPPSVSTAEYIATATVIFTALGAIWGLRKVIKLINRS